MADDKSNLFEAYNSIFNFTHVYDLHKKDILKSIEKVINIERIRY